MITFGSLRVDGVDSPLAAAGEPRFSWVVAADAPGKRPPPAWVTVADRAGPVWVSEPLSGNDVVYAGPPLREATAYDWSVRAAYGTPGHGRFCTGLDDWAGSAWIAGPSPCAPRLRRTFIAPDIVRAQLFLAAGGIAVARLNGRPAFDEVLAPGFSDWDRRVQYAVADVTTLLHPGENVLALELGRGFYAMTTGSEWGWETAPWHGDPCVRAVLLADTAAGSVWRLGTDGDWTWTPGPTRADSLYEGTVFDARRDQPGWDTAAFAGAGWAAAQVIAGPRGPLVPRRQPPVRVVETLAPSAIVRHVGSVVVSFPRQVAGWARIRVDGPADTTVTLTYGEALDEAGHVIAANHLMHGRFQTDEVILAGGPLQWESQFSYFGFQHVEVRGWPGELTAASIAGRVVHNDVARTGAFAASTSLFTRLHEAAVATVLNNLHHVPTDTPAYEKNGWTGDVALGAELMLRSLDLAPLLEKWVDDVADSCDPSGRPALIAPNPAWHWADHMQSPPWQIAYVTVPWDLYWHTGDIRILQRHYDGMLRYVRLEHAGAVGHLSASGLGDYLAPDTEGNPDEDLRLCGTAYVYRATTTLAAIARRLRREQDAAELDTRATAIAAAFNAQWLTDRGYVDAIGGFRQTHQVLALAFGLVPPSERDRVLRTLVADIEARDGHLWVGALGAKHLLRVLTAGGYADLAMRVATQPTWPGWGSWIAQGATTMWEHWSAPRSRDHYFFGTVDDWFYGDLAGVRLLEPGYRRVRVQPYIVDGLDWVRATVGTPLGPLAVAWDRGDVGAVLRLTVPVGCVVEAAGATFTAGRHETTIPAPGPGRPDLTAGWAG